MATNHLKVYLNHFGLDETDFISCEFCGAEAVDIHHLKNRGMGGSKIQDYIENLMALCRYHHEKAHRNRGFNDALFKIHADYLQRSS